MFTLSFLWGQAHVDPVFSVSEFIIYYYNLVSLLILYRREQAAGTRAAKDVCSYGPSTGVTGYRKHLASQHIAEWVTTCDKAKIKIDAATVANDIAAFREEAGLNNSEPTAGPSRRQFSKEGFIDAILEWIVADDQVSDSPFSTVSYMSS